LPEAARLYRLAGDKGYALAYASLGKLYEHGRGVRQDYAEALRLYKLALEGGSSLGAFYVAEMLEKGFGVERNEHEALRHYRLAEELGDTQVHTRIARLEAKLGQKKVKS
jgi:TPR repeat protein